MTFSYTLNFFAFLFSQARTLVVDMGFLLEAKKQSALPEAMMGTVRLTNIEMNGNLRTVKDY